MAPRLAAPVLLTVALCAAAATARAQPPVPSPIPVPEEDEEPAAPLEVLPPEERATLDRDIEQHLEGVFANVEALRDVDVRVRSGVVRLTGTAATLEAEERAVDLAQGLEGVAYVEDRIEQAESLRDRIEPAFDRIGSWLASAVALLPLLGIALLVVAAFGLLARLLARWEAPFRFLHRRRLVRGVIQQITATVVVLLGVVVALELVEATALVGAVVGAAGLLGLTLGFAFRDIAENYLASILLGTQRPFAAGDHVVIEAHEGKVVRMTTRETVLMTLEGNHLRLPNSTVYKAIILNYTRNPLRQLWFDVGVGPDADLVEAQHIGVSTLRETPGVILEPPPQSRIEQLGEWSVPVRFLAWIDQREADWFKVRSEAIRRVKSALDAAGIPQPVPSYHVETVSVDSPSVRAARDEQRTVARRELGERAHEVGVDDVLERQMASERPTGETDLLTDGR